MEAGSWDRASASFSDAVHNSSGEAKIRAAQYLAAVRLCKVYKGARAYPECTVDHHLPFWDAVLCSTCDAI